MLEVGLLFLELGPGVLTIDGEALWVIGVTEIGWTPIKLPDVFTAVVGIGVLVPVGGREEVGTPGSRSSGVARRTRHTLWRSVIRL